MRQLGILELMGRLFKIVQDCSRLYEIVQGRSKIFSIALAVVEPCATQVTALKSYECSMSSHNHSLECHLLT